MQSTINNHQAKLNHLKSAALFRDVSKKQLLDFDGLLAKLAESSRYKRLKAAETLFEMGSTGDAMYLILEGVVLVEQALETGTRSIAVRRGAGEAIGEMALL